MPVTQYTTPPYTLSSLPLLDSLQMAGTNLLSGNPAGAMSVLANPEAASPDERRKLSDRLGLTGTPLAPLVNVATHPLVVLGAILTARYKLPGAAALLTAKEGAEGLKAPISQFLQKFSGHRVVFDGTKVPDLLDHAALRFQQFGSSMNDRMANAVRGIYGKEAVSEASWLKLAAKLDGLDRTDSPKARRGWSILRDHLTDPQKRATLGLTKAQADEALSHWRGGSPVPTIVLDERETQLYGQMRSIFREVWQESISKVVDDDDAQDFLIAMGFSPKQAGELGRKGLSSLKEIEDFWPHMRAGGLTQRQQVLDEYIQKRYGVLKPVETHLPVDPAQKLVSSSKYKIFGRTGALLPEASDVAALGVPEPVLRALEAYNGRVMRGSGYSLRADTVWSRYLDATGRVYSWSLPTAENATSIGSRMADELRTLLERGATDYNSAQKARMLQNTYIPLSLGRMTQGQLAWSAAWEEGKLQAVKNLQGPFRAILGPETTDRFSKMLLNDRTFAFPAVGQSIASYLHLGALGGSVTSALQNMTQFVNTAATIGIKDTARGYREVIGRLPRFMEARRSGLSNFDAIAKVFPEFHSAHLEWDNMARQELEDALGSAADSALQIPGGVRDKARRVSEAMMSMFSATENMNRLSAFYGSYGKFRRELIGARKYNAATGAYETITKKNLQWAAADEARINVARTQYGGDFLNRPANVAGWWAPMRQFMTYPMRTAGLLMNERNPAAIAGRAMLYGGATYAAGRELFGWDLSSGLIAGSVPLPTENRPFAPLPLVPPVVGLAGASVQAAMGNPRALQQSAPLLVPGGLAASRLLQVTPGAQPVTDLIGRPHAEYSEMLPDGRVPMYGPDGSLRGYYSPEQLMLKAIGVTPRSEAQVREFTTFVRGNTERVRDMKRRYMDAMLAGETDEMVSIEQEYERVYPGAGGLPVRPSDIRSMHLRRDVVQAERALESLPSPLRSQFAATLGMVGAANVPEFMGLQAGTLGASPTINQREKYRARPLEQTKQQLGTSLHGVKLSEKMRNIGLDGRVSGSRTEQAAGNPFGADGFGSF